MPEDGLEQVCADIVDIDLADFFAATVRGTGELPLRKLLQTHGIDYQLRPASGRNDKGGKPAGGKRPLPLWLGANLTDRGGKLVFSAVINGGPAEAAGVAPGDVAVALDGVAFTPANSDRRLRSYHAGDKLELVLFRGDELITTRIVLAGAPEDTCYLQPADEAAPEIEAARLGWLHGD